MLKQIVAATLMASSLVLAELPASTQPATQPAAQAPVKKKFPTPAELARQMMQDRTAAKSTKQVAFFDLTTGFTERPSDFSLFGNTEVPTLRELIARIDAARDDANVNGALLYVGSGTGLNLAQCQEVRDALIDFCKTGKKAFVYADTFDTNGYVLASGASDICLMQGGEIFIPGVGFETMFFKGTLDKIGVHADYVQIGEYKGAEEPFTRAEPSEELKGEMNKLVEAFYQQIVSSIAEQRKLPVEQVKQVIDNVMISGEEAKKTGWIDHLVDADGLRDLMKAQLKEEVKIAHNYGEPARQQLDLSNPFAFFQMLAAEQPESTNPKVAVIYAEGTIVDGRGSSSLMGGSSVGSEDIRRALRLALRDETVKAVVIRIDSPGGSALASEAMWQAARRVAEKKPLIISVGSVAASGGYYLASAGEWIVADPSAIVGSIGVVGGKFVMTDLFEKLGITTVDFKRGENAGLFSSNERFDDRQRLLVRKWMKNTYEQFTQRVTSTRGDKIKDIDKVARGRIFLASDAQALGMVDELGGLKKAINAAAERGKLEAGGYDVMVLPKPATFADLIAGRDGAEASLPVGVTPKMQIEIKADSIMHLLPKSAQKTIGQQLQLMQILENRPVALMAPYVLTTR